VFARARFSGLEGTFFASPECARLDRSTAGQFCAPAHPSCPVPHTVGAIELGFDFGQCFAFKERSTGGLFARFAQLAGARLPSFTLAFLPCWQSTLAQP